jgi:enediyne biosynthesis protein E4
LLDVLVINRWDKAQVWRQLPVAAGESAGHWLELRLQQPQGNRDAVGAWVEVRLGADANARVVRQELTVGGGHASGAMGWMHFGLGDARAVQFRVQWPHGGWSAWTDAKVDSYYVVTEQQATLWSAP